MRIAISGTHSVGKSTFVHDFYKKYPEYIFEDEPYRALMDKHEILFGDNQTQHHINLQLNHCLTHTLSHAKGEKVIFDRAPTDFIPYSNYTALNAHTDIDTAFVKSLYERIRPALKHLDLIVFIPISEDYPIELEDDGHRPTEDFYQRWVDKAFKRLYREELNSIMPKEHAPSLIEITGERKKRIELLEAAINKKF
jgi:nicotinamide riboside kinase